MRLAHAVGASGQLRGQSIELIRSSRLPVGSLLWIQSTGLPLVTTARYKKYTMSTLNAIKWNKVKSNTFLCSQSPQIVNHNVSPGSLATANSQLPIWSDQFGTAKLKPSAEAHWLFWTFWVSFYMVSKIEFHRPNYMEHFVNGAIRKRLINERHYLPNENCSGSTILSAQVTFRTILKVFQGRDVGSSKFDTRRYVRAKESFFDHFSTL